MSSKAFGSPPYVRRTICHSNVLQCSKQGGYVDIYIYMYIYIYICIYLFCVCFFLRKLCFLKFIGNRPKHIPEILDVVDFYYAQCRIFMRWIHYSGRRKHYDNYYNGTAKGIGGIACMSTMAWQQKRRNNFRLPQIVNWRHWVF